MEQKYKKNKLQTGLINKIKTKKEKNLDKLQKEFDNINLSEKDLLKIPEINKKIYLKNHICKKYKIDNINFNCISCAKIVAYRDDGYITDDGLLKNYEIRKKYCKIKKKTRSVKLYLILTNKFN